MRERVVDFEIVMRDVGEDAAFDPFVQAEIADALGLRLCGLFRGRQRNELLPFRPVGKLAFEVGVIDRCEERAHAAFQKFDVFVVEFVRAHVRRQLVDGAAHVDDAADHADAGALAEHGVKLFAVPAADDGLAAAHEFERERADVLQDPEFRFLVERIVLHQRARARARAAADVDLAARRAVARRVARVALDGDEAARVQPADVGRRRFVDDDFRARQAHGADTLAGVRDMEMERLAVLIPERAADVVLAGRRDVKFRFAIFDRFFNRQQKVLRGHAVMAFHGLYFKHMCSPTICLRRYIRANSFVLPPTLPPPLRGPPPSEREAEV